MIENMVAVIVKLKVAEVEEMARELTEAKRLTIHCKPFQGRFY